MSTDPHLWDVTFNSAEVALAGSLAVPEQAP
jgi:hypothetical protein